MTHTYLYICNSDPAVLEQLYQMLDSLQESGDVEGWEIRDQETEDAE